MHENNYDYMILLDSDYYTTISNWYLGLAFAGKTWGGKIQKTIKHLLNFRKILKQTTMSVISDISKVQMIESKKIGHGKLLNQVI